MLGLGNGGVVWAEKWVATGLTAVMVAATPFWMVGVEAALGGERLTRRAVIGLAMGFSGIVWLVWPDLRDSLADTHRTGAGFGAGRARAADCRRRLGARLVLLAPPRGERRRHGRRGGADDVRRRRNARRRHAHWRMARAVVHAADGMALLYLTIAGSLVGFVCYIYALHHLPTAFVSLYTYVNPIVAVALGALVLGEHVGWRYRRGGASSSPGWRSPRREPGRRGDPAPTARPRVRRRVCR